jgi:hypothetical protein
MGLPIIWKGMDQIKAAAQADPQGDAVAGFSGQWRWFAGTIVLVPILLAAGVYWLHQQPSGSALHSGEATIHVELIQTPGPTAEFKQASVQTSPPIADFQTVPVSRRHPSRHIKKRLSRLSLCFHRVQRLRRNRSRQAPARRSPFRPEQHFVSRKC